MEMNRKYLLSSLCLSLVIAALIDRMGDAKDKVRDEAQTLMLKLMDQVAPPMVGLHFTF